MFRETLMTHLLLWENAYALIYKGSIVRLKPSDVLHIPGLGFDMLVRRGQTERMDMRNNIRELENLNLIPAEEGGDLYLINGNMLPLKDAGAFANAEPGKKEDSDEEVRRNTPFKYKIFNCGY